MTNNLAVAVAAAGALLAPIQPFSSVTAQGSASQVSIITAHAGQQAKAAPAETVESLKAKLIAHISQPKFTPAAWGVKVVSLDTGKTLFDHNSDKYFNPASNAKLYTVALALDRMGADYRIKTSLYSTVRPDSGGTLKGDLIVYGRGDPAMAARLNEGDYYKPLEPLATALVNAGVRRIEGDLVGDESYFAGPPFGSGWDWDDLQWYYGAEVSALSINDNSVDVFARPADRVGIPARVSTGPPTSHVTLMNRTQTVAKGEEIRVSVYRPVGENIIYISGRVPIGSAGYSGSVAVHNPAALFVSLFKEVLARRGIEVTGRLRTIDWKYREVTPLELGRLNELGSVESLPMRDLARETLKPSQNLYAQLLLLQVGANNGEAPAGGANSASALSAGAQGQSQASNPHIQIADSKSQISNLKSEIAKTRQPPNSDPFLTTEEAGVEAMNAFLTEVGVKKGDVLLEEGSGLSRRDIITPAATVELLKFMSRHRWADAYKDAMPIAAVDGTLQNRMKGTVAANNVHAKTGSLRYVYTLSGYVTDAGGERLAFSIMLNNYFNADRTASPREDIDAIAVMLAGFTGHTKN